MMQITENPTFLQQANPSILSSSSSSLYYQTSQTPYTPYTPTPPTTTMIRPIWPTFPTPTKSSLTSNNISGDTNCMEQLLVHCAEAIEKNDATPAHQILWVLNNIAPPDGDTNQRLTCAFLRALILRAARSPATKLIHSSVYEKVSLLELANFVHLTPWFRFGFTAANAIIMDAIEGSYFGLSSQNFKNNNNNDIVVHIVDVSITQCMQMPTLIDAISTRFEQAGRNPPLVRLTVGVITENVPPMFDNVVSYNDVGLRLVSFARSRGVVLDFKAVPTTPSNGFASLVDNVMRRCPQEMMVINCQMSLHYLKQHEEFNSDIMSMRTIFLKEMRSLEPDIVVLVEEDIDFSSRSLVGRLKSAYNYFWIPYDTVDTFLAKGSKEREWYEADICWKIENVIAHEGGHRVERQEPRGRWVQRMTEGGFRGVGFGVEAAGEVKGMVEEHGVGWGCKKEDDHLVLTWKGHNVAFASAWVPC